MRNDHSAYCADEDETGTSVDSGRMGWGGGGRLENGPLPCLDRDSNLL